VVRETGRDPRHAIIWLHGLGADGNDFAPIVPQLQCARTRPVRFVFPHAPVRPVTVNGGMRMRAWYDIAGFEIARDQDRAGIAASVTAVERLIVHELETGIPPERIVLAGFSQGGAIALRGGLARDLPLAGIVGLSCYLLEAEAIDDWLTAAGRATPTFMAHGEFDPVVPWSLGRRSARRIKAAGVPVEWSEWPIQHGVAPEELAALDRWLEGRLAGGGA